MSFSARQLHCLKAMGLVGWTQGTVQLVPVADKPSLVVPATHPDANSGEQQSGESIAGDAVLPVTASAKYLDETPTELPSLAQWLVEQPIAAFKYRGTPVNYVGPDQASLLVICLVGEQTLQQTAQLPMSAEGIKLFELMMRSINLSRNSFRQCAILGKSFNQLDLDVPEADFTPCRLDTLLTPHTNAVLVLDPAISASNGDADQCLMPQCSLPLWRIPHPETVLQNPQLKRRAWEALKSLQSVICT